jgi:hypothetical protein
VSKLSQQQLALVDQACYQHRRKPGAIKRMFQAAQASPVTASNVAEGSMYHDLVPQLTTPRGGVAFKAMAMEWNAHYYGLLADGRAGSIRPKHKHHLKQYHASLAYVRRPLSCPCWAPQHQLHYRRRTAWLLPHQAAA